MLKKKAKISIIIFIIIVIVPSFFLFYLWKHPELYTPYLIHQLEKVTGLKVSIEKGTINFRKGRFGFSLVKVTLRKNEAEEFLKKMFEAKSELDTKNFDNQGNLSFGIEEYLNVPGMK